MLLISMANSIDLFSQQEEMPILEKAIKMDTTNLELLLMINQEIARDKATLQNLLNDSTKLEPYFQNKTKRFLELDAGLDTVQKEEISPQQLSILEIEWESTKLDIDFSLEYRRSIYQKIKILKRKIIKLEEVAEFITIGELGGIMEIDEQMQYSRKSTGNQKFEMIQADTALLDFPSLNQYNWRVVVAERELDLLRAKFEYIRKNWVYAAQVQNLNKDHLSATLSILESSKIIVNQLTAHINDLNKSLLALGNSTSEDQLITVLEKRIAQLKNFKNSIENSTELEKKQVDHLKEVINGLSYIQEKTPEKITAIANKIERKNQWVTFLKSPLAPRNIYSFAINRGPRILLILFIIVILWISIRWLVYQILKRVIKYGTVEEREERVDTLNRATRSSLTLIFLALGTITLLSEFGINISVLLGGAAVFSLAIAFGAQSLVKDYFSGFMILTENQYRIGNVVKINGISGMVEDISLRTTILRDLAGVAHFIPHGEITIVSNLTHIWSRVDLSIAIAYKEDVDRVMEITMEIITKMREEPQFKNQMTAAPEMLGVDALSDSAVIIKVLIKTKPLKQWIIKREILRRIKNRFDELGIEIPLPHRVIYHRDLNIPGIGDGPTKKIKK
jgi:small conductance mechanosensitive channel